MAAGSNSYIRILQTGFTIFFHAMPEDISDSKSNNWSPVEIIGRSHALLGYSGGSNRELSFTLEYNADTMSTDQPLVIAAGALGGFAVTQMIREIQALKSLTYPDYSGGFRPPSPCLISIGAGAITMLGVANNVGVTYKGPWDGDRISGYTNPRLASVQLSFQEVSPIAISASQVRSSTNYDAAIG